MSPGFFVLVLSFIFVSNARAQELRFEFPQFSFDKGKEIEIDVKPPPGQIDTEMKCFSFLEFGELQNTFFDFALENDWISSDDQAYTHGLRFGFNFIGEKGNIRVGYGSKLFTNEIPTASSSSNEVPDDLREFLEITELRFDYTSRPTQNGSFYRAGVGIQQYTDEETPWGARFQQQLFHGAQEALGKRGAHGTEYLFGDTNELSFIASVGVGKNFFTEDQVFYCRAVADAQLNTVFERSWLRGRVDGGIAVCQDEDGIPILELIGTFECRQYVAGRERDTTLMGGMRLNLDDLPFGRASLNIGVIKPIETSERIYRYTDDDLIGVLNLSWRLGSSHRRH